MKNALLALAFSLAFVLPAGAQSPCRLGGLADVTYLTPTQPTRATLLPPTTGDETLCRTIAAGMGLLNDREIVWSGHVGLDRASGLVMLNPDGPFVDTETWHVRPTASMATTLTAGPKLPGFYVGMLDDIIHPQLPTTVQGPTLPPVVNVYILIERTPPVVPIYYPSWPALRLSH